MSENKEKVPAPPADKELDDLLESALVDMAPPASGARKESVGGSPVDPNLALDGVDWNPSENVWSEEFLQQAAATFESNMASLLSSMKGCSEESISQDQIAATFQMMAEAAAQVMKPAGQAGEGEANEDPQLESEEKPTPFNDVSAAISQALESMNTNADSLQQTPFNEEALKNMFAGMNMGGGEQEDPSGNMFLPFMQGMMQSLLSKEVLYPSLKDIVDKYPTWLKENKDKVSAEDYDRYVKQNELMNKVCTELEAETETDSDEVKKARFDTVLTLMQQMQELGQPPEELSGELPSTQMMAPTPPPVDMNQCKAM